MRSELLLGLPLYEISDIRQVGGAVRHQNWGLRPVFLDLEARKWLCLQCGRYFRDRFPGILPRQRASEAFQEIVFRDHRDGINWSCLGRREGIGAATVERYFRRGLLRQSKEWHSRRCPQVLGIDEHFFTRRKGFATTLCDLRNHKVYDVVLGRSELSLAAYFQKLEGKAEVRVVCMDLYHLPFAGPAALPQRAHCGRPLSCHPDHQSSLPGLLETDRCVGVQEPRTPFPDAEAQKMTTNPKRA